MTTLRPTPKNIQVERTDSLVLQPLDGPKQRGQSGIAVTKEYQASRVLRRLYNLCRYRSKLSSNRIEFQELQPASAGILAGSALQ